MALFTEDSDEDSIATDTTAESVHSDDHGFNVEQILAESTDETGARVYLVKWEGYPLDRSTWEGQAQFESDEQLRRWRARKKAAARGGEALFDVDEYELVVEKALEEKEEKAKRRQAKRKKRGELSSRSQSPIKRIGSAPTASRRVSAASTVKKKGVAQKVVRTAQPSQPTMKSAKPTSVSSEAGAASKSIQPIPKSAQPARKTAPSGGTSTEPKVPEMKRRSRVRVSGDTPKDSAAPKFTKLATQNRYQSYSRNEPAPDINALTMFDPKAGRLLADQARSQPAKELVSRPVESAPPQTVERRQSQPQLPKNTPAQVAAARSTTSASSVAGERATVDQDRPARRPEPARTTSEQAPRQSVTLPKSTTTRPTDIHSAYGRRTPPQERRRRRSPSPPTPKTAAPIQTQAAPSFPPAKRPVCEFWQSGICRYTSETCAFAHTDDGVQNSGIQYSGIQNSGIQNSGMQNTGVQNSDKRFTCHWWRNGNKCRHTAEQCTFAHWETGRDPPGSLLTCFYWATTGNCKNSAEQCKFAHWDTGRTAPPPKGYSFPPQPAARPHPSTTAISHSVGAPEKVHHAPAAPAVPESLVAEDLTMAEEEGAAEPVEDSMMNDFDAPAVDREAQLTHDMDLDTEDEAPETAAERIRDDLVVAKKSIRKLDAASFLSKSEGLIKYAYILMPPERDGERNLLADCIKSLNCEVWHSGNAQHWDVFRKGYSNKETLVIVHPEETFSGTLPHFASFALRGKCSVFSIGVHEDWNPRNGSTRTYEARRVFPHGGFTFISDDIFAYYPEKATEIIKTFHDKAKTKPPGAETSKIGTRPNIRDWLAKLAVKKVEEGGDDYADDRYVTCWDAICDLCPLEDYDPWELEHGRMVPKDDALLWSVAEQDLPSFQGLWEKDEARATEMMANFFAGTAVERMADFQRYSFVYQRPDQTAFSDEIPASQLAPQMVTDLVDPQGWMKQYNHVEVMTPANWLYHWNVREHGRGSKQAQRHA